MNDSGLRITVGTGTCGLAAGARETLGAIQAELRRRGLEAAISQVGCVGMCSYEPMVELRARGRSQKSRRSAADFQTTDGSSAASSTIGSVFFQSATQTCFRVTAMGNQPARARHTQSHTETSSEITGVQ
jgi:hypothetical protein